MLGQLSLAACTLGLGLSRTFTAALASRCVASALNGNLAVCCAALRDLTPPAQRSRRQDAAAQRRE